MEDFTIRSLNVSDGTWQAFEDDWRTQCDEVGEPHDDYSPDSLAVLRNIAAGNVEQTALSQTSVAAIKHSGTGQILAVCMLNRALIPNSDGYTLRIRHLIVSPLLDYGHLDNAMYAEVLVGTVMGIIQVSSTVLEAQHLRFHLRSPEDMAYFKILGGALGKSNLFSVVETRGAWLLLTKSADFVVN